MVYLRHCMGRRGGNLARKLQLPLGLQVEYARRVVEDDLAVVTCGEANDEV